MYRVETTPEFDDDLRKLDKGIAAQILKKIEWFSNHPEAIRFLSDISPKI